MADETLSYDGDWLVEELVPGLIVAHAGMCFGKPTIKGTRVHVGVARAVFLDPENYEVTHEQALALYAFAQGMAWQRSGKRRRRMEMAVAEGWEKHHQRRLEGAT